MSVVILRRLAVAVLLPLLLIGGCSLFPESRFKLASESRLPKWFDLPPGLSRADATVTMYNYITPWSGRTAEFELSDANGKKLAVVIGKKKGLEPISLIGVDPSSGLLVYPTYAIVTVNGMTEVIEHRQRGSVFHITDDIEVLTKLGLKNK